MMRAAGHQGVVILSPIPQRGMGLFTAGSGTFYYAQIGVLPAGHHVPQRADAGHARQRPDVRLFDSAPEPDEEPALAGGAGHLRGAAGHPGRSGLPARDADHASGPGIRGRRDHVRQGGRDPAARPAGRPRAQPRVRPLRPAAEHRAAPHRRRGPRPGRADRRRRPPAALPRARGPGRRHRSPRVRRGAHPAGREHPDGPRGPRSHRGGGRTADARRRRAPRADRGGPGPVQPPRARAPRGRGAHRPGCDPPQRRRRGDPRRRRQVRRREPRRAPPASAGRAAAPVPGRPGLAVAPRRGQVDRADRRPPRGAARGAHPGGAPPRDDRPRPGGLARA